MSKVLIIDDDEDDYILTRDLLMEASAHPGSARHVIEWVPGFEEGLERICCGKCNVALVDYRLGAQGRSGLDLIRQAVARECAVPMILLTGQGDHEIDVEAMRAGAVDYMLKGQMTAPLLERSIRYAIERSRNLRALLASQEQLRQAQKLEAVGQLAGGVAHDFNNLLTGITGYTELLLAQVGEQSPLRDDLSEILKAAGHAKAMTTQLLAFSRKHVVQPIVLDISTTLTDLHNLLQRLIGEDIEMRTVLCPRPLYVRADRGHIEQVIVNLAVNARDAMPQGGVLTLSTSEAAVGPVAGASSSTGVTSDLGAGSDGDCLPSGRYVVLSISDTGVGMDEQTRLRIFEPFFTTKQPGQGTGLGLSTVYGIIHQSGGHIRVHSRPRQGTTFRVYFPLVVDAAPAASQPVSESAPPAGGETILLVEDQDMVRSLVRRILRSSGYTVLEARDGQEALAVSQHHRGPLDLLLTDMVMPKMGGRELAENLRKTHPGTRALFMSGYAAAEVDDAVNLKAAYLQKPFTMDQLMDKVREVLSSGQLHPAR